MLKWPAGRDDIRSVLASAKVVKHKKMDYYDAVCSFDIEVYSDPATRQGSMYIWQFCCEDVCVYGRTWDEYIELTHLLQTLNAVTVVYVHNLSYEFQFLRSRFEWDTIFALKPRKVLYARSGNIEYRCSYKLSNMSLAAASAKYNKHYKKQSGEEFDYSVYRDAQTALTDEQLKYCEYDVRAVVELVHVLLDRDNDDITSIPLTSTGYVRRDAKHALRYRRNQLSKLTSDPDCFNALREAFRGGNTHSNRYITGQILRDVHSADRSSSYPDVLCNEKYPMTPFIPVDAGAYRRYIDSTAVLMRVAFSGLHCNWDTTLPYLSFSKCRKVFDYSLDNGRILDAAYLECTLTDIDFRIMERLYTWEHMTPVQVWVSYYDVLPQEFIDLNIEYYRRKTTLKNVDGQELYYLKAKEQLNSLYGMCAQNPVRDEVLLSDGEWIVKKAEVEASLVAYRKKGFVPYSWAVWCTTHARNALQWGIDAAGENFVYADTDSVKYMGEVDWTPFNTKREDLSIQRGSYADDPQGKRHYMGVYEMESTASRFVTLGAKRYAYEDETGAIHLTVAGVNKKAGEEELARRGGLEIFTDGLIFYDAGRTTLTYNDEYPSNIYMEHSNYTMSLSRDYSALLDVLSGRNADEEISLENI